MVLNGYDILLEFEVVQSVLFHFVLELSHALWDDPTLAFIFVFLVHIVSFVRESRM